MDCLAEVLQQFAVVDAGTGLADQRGHLRREARDLKEVVAEQALELRLLKKHDRGWGRRRMRYPASEKLEIVRFVEGSHLPTKRTLDRLGIPRTTFYRWYDRYLAGGPEAPEDRSPQPSRVWNRIPEPVLATVFTCRAGVARGCLF